MRLRDGRRGGSWCMLGAATRFYVVSEAARNHLGSRPGAPDGGASERETSGAPPALACPSCRVP